MKNVLILGTGKSGIGCARLLRQQGIPFAFYDGNPKVALPEEWQGVALYTGNMTDEAIAKFDTAVLSPGVPIDCDIVNRLRDAGVEISGEIELAWSFCKSPVLAVTGTNGKTTTVSLIGEICASVGTTAVVGNIGNPMTEAVMENPQPETFVAEISSFQLETVKTFHPRVAAVLNITPDHLNRHYTMECYRETKLRIGACQTEEDVIVLNYEDEALRKAAERMKGRTVFFSSKRPVDGACIRGEMLTYFGEDILPVREVPVPGDHNLQNVLAAIAVCKAYGIETGKVADGIRNFKAVEHRLEYVDTFRGVKYYNDSKGTNPDAAIFAIRAMDGPTVLIAGGYDKGSDYEEWLTAAKPRVKALLLMGVTADAIEATAHKVGIRDIRKVENMREAVLTAKRLAEEGDNVLLSPACASWGMYENYEVRGRDFKNIVRQEGNHDA